MFDFHYDLLSYIYMNKNNIKKIKRHCNKIFKNNITGGIFNLFYMTKEEMKGELGIEPQEIDIIENLKTVINIIDKYNLIPQNTNYIFGIEGLDYLKNIEDINILYKMGVRAINPVWSNENKFGGGIRSKIGLTKLGEKLIDKLVDMNIIIDLSHSNEKTFFDIINICKDLKQKGKNPLVIASHSNAKTICDVPRNLSDEQLLEIKNLNGIVGIVEIKNFCRDSENLKENFEQDYIKHINYVRHLFGGVDNIGVATDDMSYYKIDRKYYKNLNIYKLEESYSRIRKLLIENNYSEGEVEKILKENVLPRLRSDGYINKLETQIPIYI